MQISLAGREAWVAVCPQLHPSLANVMGVGGVKQLKSGVPGSSRLGVPDSELVPESRLSKGLASLIPAL